MESLLIKSELDKNSLMKVLQIRREILMLKSLKFTRNVFIVAVSILGIGFLTGIMGGEYAVFVICLGILASIFAAILIMGRIHMKRRYREKIKEEVIEFKKTGSSCIYEFSDKTVKYQDDERNVVLNWSAFKAYSIYKDYVVLLLDDTLTSFYLFGRPDATNTDFERILEFAEMKLPFKKKL